MRFQESNETTNNTIIPTGTYCPACHEDAVAVNKNNKTRRRFLSRLFSYCCIPRKHHTSTPASSPTTEELTCLVCGFLFTPLRETYSRTGSDILESDKQGHQNEYLYSTGNNLPPLRPPSSAWMRRTGFTPQPELLELMDHEWCVECGLFVKQTNDTSCSKCGAALKKTYL